MKIVTKREVEKIREFSIKVAMLYEFFNWTWTRLDGSPNAKEIEEHIV